ncbi:MAG TPA: alkaline phosphatase family protein [Acidimicrobiales bacterium]
MEADHDGGPAAKPERSSFADLIPIARGRRGLSRRSFLKGSAAGVAAGVLGPSLSGLAMSRAAAAGPDLGGATVTPGTKQWQALQALSRPALRWPDSLPYPNLPAGVDTMPEIEHVVLVMLENHSFDNILGMLGRGDGYTLGAHGLPTATNPYTDGRLQHAFQMPSVVQLSNSPSQEWRASYEAYNGGRMDGFVSAIIGPTIAEEVGAVAMGYFTGDELPFTYSLASTFPVADRWFGSMLGQTDPNRRFLIAGTSSGMTDDLSLSALDPQDAFLAIPAANGTIFDRFDLFNISWADYATGFPLGYSPELFPVNDAALLLGSTKRNIGQFFTDAAAGTLPSFSFVEPDYNVQSQENPQNVAAGDGFLAQVVNALGQSPNWSRSLLIFTYDEHGGYYDHVVPPVALAPDLIPPIVQPGESTYEGFERYGVRVPGLVVSPFAKRNYVSSMLYDHTSVLALLSRKWNLPAMTYRDANANDLTDLIDLPALASGVPTFPELPKLAAPGDTAEALATKSPGQIPPPGTISAAP